MNKLIRRCYSVSAGPMFLCFETEYINTYIHIHIKNKIKKNIKLASREQESLLYNNYQNRNSQLWHLASRFKSLCCQRFKCLQVLFLYIHPLFHRNSNASIDVHHLGFGGVEVQISCYKSHRRSQEASFMAFFINTFSCSCCFLDFPPFPLCTSLKLSWAAILLFHFL